MLVLFGIIPLMGMMFISSEFCSPDGGTGAIGYHCANGLIDFFVNVSFIIIFTYLFGAIRIAVPVLTICFILSLYRQIIAAKDTGNFFFIPISIPMLFAYTLIASIFILGRVPFF